MNERFVAVSTVTGSRMVAQSYCRSCCRSPTCDGSRCSASQIFCKKR